MPLIAWPPFWRARRALEVCKAKEAAHIPLERGDWRELEEALSNLGQIAITVEELRAREERHAG
jgi:hypothetical protein